MVFPTLPLPSPSTLLHCTSHPSTGQVAAQGQSWSWASTCLITQIYDEAFPPILFWGEKPHPGFSLGIDVVPKMFQKPLIWRLHRKLVKYNYDEMILNCWNMFEKMMNHSTPYFQNSFNIKQQPSGKCGVLFYFTASPTQFRIICTHNSILNCKSWTILNRPDRETQRISFIYVFLFLFSYSTPKTVVLAVCTLGLKR